MYNLLKKISLLLFVSLISVNTVIADDAHFRGNGINVIPMNSDTIEMVSENIIISQSPASGLYFVDVSILFKNHGPSQTLQLGFPYSYQNNGDEVPKWLDEPFFRTWVDGQEVDVTRKIGVKNDVLKSLDNGIVYTSVVSFKEGQSKLIRHTYHVGGTRWSEGSSEFRYILKTGALWRGTIKKINVSFSLGECSAMRVQYVSPKENTAEKGGHGIVLKWEFENIDPTFDIVIGSIGSLSRQSQDPKEVLEPFLEKMKNKEKNYIWKNDMGMSRYYVNLVYAYFGYPFQNPFVYAQFYPKRFCSAKPFALKPNPNYSEDNIGDDYKNLILWFSGKNSEN